MVLVAVAAAVVLFVAGWSVRDALLSGHGDWAASIGTFAAWTGDASKIALGALIAAVAGLAVGWMNRSEARSDRAEAAKARDQAREDARQALYLDRKVALYTDLSMACERHMRDVGEHVEWRNVQSDEPGPKVGSTERAYLAYYAIRLLAPADVVDAASRLYLATSALEVHVVEDDPPARPPDMPKWEENAATWGLAALRFEKAATKDLLVVPEEPGASTP